MNLNSQNQFYFLFFTLLGHITSVNNVVVTVLYLLRALHRRIIVYRILYKIKRIRASLATAIYDNKQSRLFIIWVAGVDRALS